MRTPRAAGGWRSILYALQMARQAGGLMRFYRALRSKNACKTCALGMGGQRGGMVNEAGHFPEICKKSMQAMAADMQGRIRAEFWRRYGFAELRALSPRNLEHMGRLSEPVYAGPDEAAYRPITWDEALSLCEQRLRSAKADENFFYFSGRASNEAAFLWQLFARLYGTNNVNNCSYYCHQASGVALSGSVGSGTATIRLDDLAGCDALFLIGGNPASNHPRLMTMLMNLRRRGGQVIVINPLRETGLVRFSVPSDLRSLVWGSPMASEYVQPHIGGDIALLTAIAKRIDELGAADEAFIAAHTHGGAAFREFLRSQSIESLAARSGVELAIIDRVARLYASSKAAVFAWTMGITHHVHGVDNVRAIVNLALLRGMVGRPHAGLLPIRGHSNVQGVGSMGVSPRLRDAVLDRLQRHFGVTLPTTPGMDTLSCMEAMREGRIRNAWCLGGNLFGSNPDAARAASAFGELESAVYLSTTLNTGHAWGRARHTLILPVRARDEEDQPTTQESMFNLVRLSEGGPARHSGTRSEVQIVADLARRVLGDTGPIDWRAMERHTNIRRAIAAAIPGYEEIAEIDRTRREFQIASRTLHEPRFKTPDGNGHFHITPPPDLPRESGQLRLMTIRSEGQFNTVVYEDYDLYRGQERRDVILMSAADIAERGLRENDLACVRSEIGEMRVLVREAPIRAGNAAMYYPEANVLVPAVADPQSRTPAFKSVLVTVSAAREPQAVRLQVAEASRG
ncbi:MAG: FdhF/YdeP family oxidoreductase [Phycisphaerae bacterium]